MCDGQGEDFFLSDESGVPAGIWCSFKDRLIVLPDEGCVYRLDRFEVNPAYRGGFVSTLLAAVVATRALELGAAGMVLASLPGALDFWIGLGGVQRMPRGWSIEEEKLIPVVFTREALVELKEDIDELVEQ